MDKTFQPADIETKWYQQWEEKGYFSPQGKGDSYSIMIPPPNVTGSLHMGHAFQDSIMDALTRYHRMQGKNTLWQVGTDHAGIATQMLVERKLAAETGQTRAPNPKESEASVAVGSGSRGLVRPASIIGAMNNATRSATWSSGSRTKL